MNKNITITVITITYNEERIIPFFLKYYSTFADHIVVYDNLSSDNTKKICEEFKGCKITVIEYNSNDLLDDSIYLEIKNNAYKNYDTDYCIIVDVDEFLYCTDLKKFLYEHKDILTFKATGFNMISKEFPEKDNILQIKSGVRDATFDKCVLFKNNYISKIEYHPGCHSGNFFDTNNNKVIPFCTNYIKLLHYKFMSFEYAYTKHLMYKKRMSNFNLTHGYGYHYLYSKEQQLDIFNKLLSESSNII
jgi:glycosyltransferase involved in cell wall biosynthesis